jgi:hypothetical protein
MDWFKDDPKSTEIIKEGIRQAFEEGFGEVEALLRRKDGERIPMYLLQAVWRLRETISCRYWS